MPTPIQDVTIRLNVLPGNQRAPQGVAPPGPGGGAPGGGGGGGGLLAGLGIAAGIGSVAVGAPGVFKLFTDALTDIAGIIGQTLAPVLEVFTQGLRLVGDVLASILPSQEQMAELMKPIKELFDELRKVFETLIPILRPIIDLFIEVGTAIVNIVAEGLKILLQVLRGFLEALGFEVKELKSAVGAGAHPASFISVPGLGQEARRAAFSVGAAQVQLGREQKRDNTFEAIRKIVQDILDFMRAVGTGAGVARGLVETGARAAASQAGMYWQLFQGALDVVRGK